jgi:hypothetical protein
LDPLLLELPVRANEAAALAEAVFQQIDGRRLTDDMRNRVAGRAALLGLETIHPFCGSLQSDPIHPNCYFLAIDAVRGGVSKPYLLRIATATAPSSGLFQKSILIGRMRPGGGREIVINAVPFGPEDRSAIQTFAREVDRAFLPKPSGTAFSVTVTCDWHTAVWQAIRAGQREGYAVVAPPLELRPDQDPLPGILDRTGYTKIVLDIAALPQDLRLSAVSAAIDAAVKANASEQWTWRRPDLELSWRSSAAPTGPGEVAELLAALKDTGRPVQAVSPHFGAQAAEMVAVIKAAGAVVSVRSTDSLLDELAQLTGGRLHCTAQPGEDIRALVRRLRTP